MTCVHRINGDQEGHRQHQGKEARKADYSVQCGRVGLIESSPAIWLPLLVFPTGQLISGPWYSYCNENVVYIMWCYITFGTAVINIVTDPTQVRV